MDASNGWLIDRRAIDAALRADPTSTDDVLAALARVDGLRAGLDQSEEQLIALAREHGVSWARIAGSLGLRSRQAAEQRWVRLRAAVAQEPASERARRERQQILDAPAGADVAYLRSRVSALHLHLARRRSWGEYQAAAELARATLAATSYAPPGALYDLARLAVTDLRAIPPEVLGPQTTAALAQVSALAAERLT